MEKGVLRNFTKFTGKHLCQSLFFSKVAGLRPAALVKKRLWHRCFPVNFVKFLRTPFLQSTSGRLLLYNFQTIFESSSKNKTQLEINSISKASRSLYSFQISHYYQQITLFNINNTIRLLKQVGGEALCKLNEIIRTHRYKFALPEGNTFFAK